MYNQPYSFQPGEEFRPPQPLLKEIEKAVNDEFQAIHYYTRLAELAPHKNSRDSILAIRQDEIRHFYRFSKIYHQLSGRYPKLSLAVDLPGSFRSGVRASIKDEQETVPFYHRIASQLTIPQMREHVLRAANDEHRHAQIFSQIESSL